MLATSNVIIKIVGYIATFLAILIVLPLHEFAHAFVAVKCGDDTPRYSGRYTLNPFAHFDPLGLVMLMLFRFGWAKPVPINPNNFKNYKKGIIYVSIAGVTANILLAILVCPLYLLSYKFVINAEWAYYLNVLIVNFFYALFYLNIGLFVFNLIPVYPLDGFRVYDAIAVRRGKTYYFLRNNGFYIMIGILVLGVVADFTGLYWLDFINVATGLIGNGIIKIWSLVL